MGNGSKSKCSSASHRHLKDKANKRVDDLQRMLNDLQSARIHSQTNDIMVLEEQAHQMLSEWKSELNEPSPASSLQAGSLGSFSNDIARLLQLDEEEDDATSALPQQTELKAEIEVQAFCSGNPTISPEGYVGQDKPQYGYQECEQRKDSSSAFHDTFLNDTTIQMDHHQMSLYSNFAYELLGDNAVQDYVLDVPNIVPYICPPPSAFLGPKCALWDCSRPAQGSELCQNYCSTDHAVLALSEGQPGMAPVLRPSGISLKDGPIFAALIGKTQGKDVGIPECDGAVSAKSPWNAPELFNLPLFEGETIREWLFFDKPRRAFESGNRKQRSLPDYSGRGWHESRKVVMKEYEGQRRSYYMDPQPPGIYEWHLYEYEVNNSGTYSLYRLELKLANEKKSPKGKVTSDPLADLQTKMGRLTAEVCADKCSPEGSMKADKKANSRGKNANYAQKQKVSTTEV